MRKSFSVLVVVLLAVLAAIPALAQAPARVEQRVESLLSQMTLDEKIDMIGGGSFFATYPIPRLGIPAFHMTDGPVGAHVPPPSTAFAAGIGLAASWNPALAEQIGHQLGRDAKSRGAAFLLGPGVNIYRTPLNGRNYEYFGEDPFLASRIAVGYINGVQSEGVSATIKHYAGNNSEFARFTSDSLIDERTLREIYLPVFETAVKEAHVGAVMDSYNLTNGEHMSQNGYLNNQVLKKQWGFPGVLMSDWISTHDGVAAANGGLDLEMPFADYMNRATLLPAIQQGKVSVATIDDKVRRILRTAITFGWMDHDPLDLSISRYNQQSRPVALEGARQGMVLLKNDGNLLPLDSTKIKTIAVIGPNAFPAVATAGGSGEVQSFASVSFLQGLSDTLAGSANVTYARGIPSLSRLAKETAFFTTPARDIRGVTVETFDNLELSGAPVSTRNEPSVVGSRSGPGDPDDVESLLTSPHEHFKNVGDPAKNLTASRWTGYYRPAAAGTYDIFVEYGGMFRLFVDDKLILDCSVVPLAAVNQVSRVLGIGPHKFVLEQLDVPQFVESFIRMGVKAQGSYVDPHAVEIAAKADAVVVAVGFVPETETEGADREFRLPPGQEELIRQVADVNPNTIVVLTSGGAVDTFPWLELVPALIEAWYPGQEGGTALSEVLFGKINPSGRLPISWERSLNDNPSYPYYHYTGTNKIEYKEGIFVGYRGYDRGTAKPLFPFGFGLSYTTFKYANLDIQPVESSTGPGPHYAISFDVTNTGTRAGADVAQVYVAPPAGKTPRPVKELKGFSRVELKPGETRNLQVLLNGRSFTYFDVASKQWHADPGRFEVLVGQSSQRTDLAGAIALPRPIDLGLGD